VGGADMVQLLGHDVMREFRPVTFAAQMGEVKVAKVCGHNLRSGFGGGLVGKMAVPAQNTLFQAPGTARTFPQHLHVMIRFQDQHICGAGSLDHQFGRVPKVGGEADVAGRGTNQKSDRVLRIVRDGKRVYNQIPNLEAGAGFKQITNEFGLQLKFKRFLRGAVAVNRDVQLLRDAGEAVNMVAVLMGDEDGGQVLRRAPDAGEALADLAWAEPGVHEHAGFSGLQIGAVAAGTTAENREFNSHSWTLIARKRGGKFFPAAMEAGPAERLGSAILLQLTGEVGWRRGRFAPTY